MFITNDKRGVYNDQQAIIFFKVLFLSAKDYQEVVLICYQKKEKKTKKKMYIKLIVSF